MEEDSLVTMAKIILVQLPEDAEFYALSRKLNLLLFSWDFTLYLWWKLSYMKITFVMILLSKISSHEVNTKFMN